jgi:hypothetical protein
VTRHGLISRCPAATALWETNLLDLMANATTATTLAVPERPHFTGGSTADYRTRLVTRPGSGRRRAAPIDGQQPLSP